jgi:hypothetical protein
MARVARGFRFLFAYLYHAAAACAITGKTRKVQVWQIAEGLDRSPDSDHEKTGARSVRD